MKFKPIKFKFRYFVLMLFLFIGGLLFSDRFFAFSTDMEKLKNDRRMYLLALDEKASIKIGVTWPFFFDNDQTDYFKQGIELAINELNKENRLGRKVEAIFRDDKWEENEAKSIAKEFVFIKDMVAVIAHDDEELALPASITYESAGVVMIAPAVSYPLFIRSNFNYIFRNTPSDVDIGEKLANYAGKMKFKKMVVLNLQGSAYAETLAQVFQENAVFEEIEVVYSDKFTEDEKSFTSILSDLSPFDGSLLDYDAIFIAGTEEELPIFIKQARAKGIYAPFLTGDTLDLPLVNGLEETLENVIVATIFNQELLEKRTQAFITDFKKEYGVLPDTWAAQGYDAVMLIAKAIEETDSLDPELIAHRLRYMKSIDSIFGKYSLTPKGNVKNRQIYIKRVVNGHFEYVHFN